MSGWIVYSKDGSIERCKLRSLEYGGTAMGERAVTATFDYHSEVAFEVFDYIEYRGERFELEAVPTVKKLSSFEYQYELRFVSLKYELERCEMRDIVPSDNGVVYPTPLTFSFTGDVRYLTDRIQACLDAMYGAGVWKITIAEGTSSEEKNITIAQQNCWNALALVNSTYGLNFYIKGRTITIGGEQPLVSHTFEYGKGNGLYEIERASDTETGIVTKLRAYGSTKNLDYSYPKKPEWSDSVLPVSFALSPLRLMLPSFKADGKTDFVLADNAAIAKYGIREASMVYDDIYPSIAGATYNGQAIDEIKAVDAVDESQKTFVVYLHELGFDLEEHLTTSDAQISMKSGALQGYTFTISSIEKQTGGYKITLGKNSLENSEESGAYVPGVNWNMKAGDKFVLLNILMPQKYIRDAENRLLARANEYLAQYSKTNFSYNIGLHDKFLIQNPSVYDSLIEGSKLKVYDKEIGIDEEVTIQSITITENLEDNILPQVKVTLNNEPSASTLDRIQGKLNEVAAETAANGFTTQSEIMAQYRRKLDKPFFDKLFVAIDANGNEIPSTDVITPIAYIKAKYHVVSVGGFTMYAMDKDVDVPSLASGLPFDGRTIWYNPDTNQIEVIGGTGGGSGEGVSNFWDLSGIPSWITNSKPKYTYSEIEGTPDLTKYALASQIPSLSGYATESWVAKQNYATKATTLSGYGITDAYTKTNVDDLLKSYVTLGGTQTITGEKNFTGGLKVNGSPIYYDSTKKYWKLEGDLLVTGGVTMYGSDSSFTPSTIMDAIVVDGTTISKDGGVLKINPELDLGGLDEAELEGYLTVNKYVKESALTEALSTYATQAWVKARGYATTSDLDSRINALVNGAPAAYDTLKEIADVLAGNVDSIGDIITTLGTKWTQDNTKIANWDTAYSWGNHASVGYALKSYVDGNFVTLATDQTISGLKNFSNGLELGGISVYKSQDGVLYLDGNLVVKGGVTMYGTDATSSPSILDSLPIASTSSKGIAQFNPSDFSVVNGVVSFVGSVDGGVASSVAWGNITGKPTFASVATSGKYSDLSGTPSSLPASDVYSWAKSANKPSYTWSEITSKPTWIGSSKPSYSYSEITGAISATELQNYLTQNSYLNVTEGDGRYLKLSGGTVSGDLFVSNIYGGLILSNTSKGHNGFLIYNGNSEWIVTDDGWNKAFRVLHEGNYSSYALPLSGGTLKSSGTVPLYLDSESTTQVITLIKSAGVSKAQIGWESALGTYFYNYSSRCVLGIKNDGTPYFGVEGSTLNTLIHSGNIGSYNAGSATKLQTAKNIWGQSFDGSGNVSGNLTLENNYEIVTKNTSGSASSTLYRTKSNNLIIGEGIAKESNDTYISGNNLFLRYGTGLTNGISLISSGNVGIGITSPSYTLDVSGTCRASISVTSNMFFTNGEYGIWKGSSFTGGLSANDLAYYAEKNVFYGNVGIGTTTLDWGKLHVYSNDSVWAGRFRTDKTQVALANPDGGGLAIDSTCSNTEFAILNIRYGQTDLGGGGNVAMTVMDNGNVGVGIANPMQRLHINGILRVQRYGDSNSYIDIQSNEISVNYKGYDKSDGYCYHAFYSNDTELVRFSGVDNIATFQGNIVARGGITMYSMRALKNVVDERGLSLSELSIIKPTRYTWKDGRDNRLHFGGIADDIQQVLPEVVYSTSDGILTMDYGNAAFAVASSLIKPVIDHENRIAMLEEENKQLRQEVERLKAS